MFITATDQPEETHNGKPLSFYAMKAKKGQKILKVRLGDKGYKKLKARGMKGKTWTIVEGRRVVREKK